MDEDNDGRFPDDSPVKVRYPRNRPERFGCVPRTEDPPAGTGRQIRAVAQKAGALTGGASCWGRVATSAGSRAGRNR
jgi:hypothetical protein